MDTKTITRVKYLLLIVFLSILIILSLSAGSQESDDGRPAVNSKQFIPFVLGKIDDQHRGDSSHGVMVMSIKTKHWSRTLEMESWSLGKHHSLIKILKPIKERGTATLKVDESLYTYLNKTGRTIKINSSMMGGSWMGSHFTNDDLIQETRLSEDYSYKLQTHSDKSVHVIELIPKPGRPIVYGKIQVAVLKDTLQPTWQLFFDEDGKKVRKMEYSDFRVSGGELFPHKMVMKPLDKSGEYTSLQWKKIEFNKKLKKSFFSIHRLKSL